MRYCMHFTISLHPILGRDYAWTSGRMARPSKGRGSNQVMTKGMFMPPSTAQVLAATDETTEAASIVERFLVASMVPDPATAALYIANNLAITFTGGRKYKHPSETAAFNAGRYKW